MRLVDAADDAISHGMRPAEPKLTRNQELVLAILRAERAAMTAYEILGRGAGGGLAAPPQVYRALDKLVALGLVHRLESRNRFIACDQAHDSRAPPVAFFICGRCDRVIELSALALEEDMRAKADGLGFRLDALHVEAVGTCSRCRGDG